MQLIKRLWSEERGEDVAEYAMTLGLIAIVAIGTIFIVGGQIETWWTNINAQMLANPVPAAP